MARPFPAPMSTYRTLAARSRFTAPPIKGSRFFATAAPVRTEEEALALVTEVEAELSEARHHCWAFRLRAEGRTRCSDAGEPGGSAGRPILARLEGKDLSDAVVVVSRIYGGTKLGVGGLIRAYGGTAGQALDAAEILEVRETTTLVVVHAYDDTRAIEAALAGVEVLDAHYGAEVRRTLSVPVEEVAPLEEALRSATRGGARFE